MCVDDSTLIHSGKSDLSEYLATPDAEPFPDFFVNDNDGEIKLD